MVLTVSFALSPVTGLSCHRRLRIIRQLDASVGASGPRDFAVRRLSALVSSAACVHRIPPRVRDDRDTPLKWDRMARDIDLIWVSGEGKYFCEKGWTASIRLIRFNKSHSARDPAGWVEPFRETHHLRKMQLMRGANGSCECAPDDKLRDTHHVAA
jgi:hypothetical protein